MNKDIFNVFKGLEAGAPRMADKKGAGGSPYGFTVPVSPNGSAGESDRAPAKWTYNRFQDAKLGEIYHEALSHVHIIPTDTPKSEAAVKELWAAQGRWFNAEDVCSRIKSLLCSPSMAQFFPSNAEVLNEKEYCDSFGNLYRIDKVIVIPKEVWVVDFKTGMEAKGHDEQLKKYIGILKELHKNKNVRGFIVRIMDLNYEEIL